MKLSDMYVPIRETSEKHGRQKREIKEEQRRNKKKRKILGISDKNFYSNIGLQKGKSSSLKKQKHIGRRADVYLYYSDVVPLPLRNLSSRTTALMYIRIISMA